MSIASRRPRYKTSTRQPAHRCGIRPTSPKLLIFVGRLARDVLTYPKWEAPPVRGGQLLRR